MPSRVPHYTDVELRIERAYEEGPYRVLMLAPGGRRASGYLELPFSDSELERFVRKVGGSRGARGFGSQRMEEAKKFGSQLFEALFSGDVRDLYSSVRSEADTAEDAGLRLTLSLSGVPELMDVPWEYLYERPSFLAQSVYTPVVRSLDLPRIQRTCEVQLPLNLLGMVSLPQGVTDLDAEQEREDLEGALSELTRAGLVRLHWLERPTMKALYREMRQDYDVHVLHYIGHGAFDQRADYGVLILEDETGRPCDISGEELGAVLADERSLRLVVLNACEGARGSRVDPFESVAAALLERDIPAVIGMQFEVTDKAAVGFAEGLYSALASGAPVDAALGEARMSMMFVSPGDIEWGTPVLLMRAADGRLFDVTGGAPGPSLEAPPPTAGDLTLALRLRPDSPAVGDQVTWRLRIENSGEVPLREVVARGPDEEDLDEPVDLRSGERHTISWTDVAREQPTTITVSGLDPAGSRVSEQALAKSRPSGVHRAPPQASLSAPPQTAPFAAAPRITRIEMPGKAPVSLAAGHGLLWVGGGLTSKGTIAAVDPATNEVVTGATTVGGSNPRIACDADALWVGTASESMLRRIDPRSRALVGAPIELPAGSDAVAVAGGSVWVLVSGALEAASLVRVDPSRHATVGEPKSIGKSSPFFVAGEKALWIAAGLKSSVVLKLDPASGALSPPVPVGGAAAGGAATEAEVWVATASYLGGGKLVRVEGATLTVSAGISLPKQPGACAAAGGSIWVGSGWQGGQLVRVDPVAEEVVGEPLPIGGRPLHAIYAYGAIWIACHADSCVTRIDLGTG
jgi:hypothetical protein